MHAFLVHVVVFLTGALCGGVATWMFKSKMQAEAQTALQDVAKKL